MSEILPDELCHMNCHADGKPAVVSCGDLRNVDFSGEVMLHNTMRFDVQLAYIQPILDDGDIEKDELIKAIREAITREVDRVVGQGLDGKTIPGGAFVIPVSKSKMLHRETISFDLS